MKKKILLILLVGFYFNAIAQQKINCYSSIEKILINSKIKIEIDHTAASVTFQLLDKGKLLNMDYIQIKIMVM